MTRPSKAAARVERLLNRLHARLSARGPISSGFTADPEPRTIGRLSRGRQLTEGRFLFGGHLVEDASGTLWNIAAPDELFDDDRHGFVWLDDLAALGNIAARQRARDWTADWIAAYGAGQGPGWRPGLTGRRVSRWISHAMMITEHADDATCAGFFRSLSQQTHFLARRHARATPGLPRFEALGGLIHASLTLKGMRHYLDPAIAALAQMCMTGIDEGGGIDSRNPEELLDIFAILTWTGTALSEAGRIVPRDHLAAIERITPVLRALRHGDGMLARFHGGGRGEDGRLDHALAASGQRGSAREAAQSGLTMGYARLSGGRTSVIVDASAPPKGRPSANAHASTLAFELTSGRRPLIVSCGPGAIFGEDWHRASRATASHSTLGVGGVSSSVLGRRLRQGNRTVEYLVDVPRRTTASFEEDDTEATLSLSHDGYIRSHGLTHSRHLRLSHDGRTLTGEDELAALKRTHKRRFDAARDADNGRPFSYAIRFHLHPEVAATPARGGMELRLKSGEVWLFTARGAVSAALEDSLYLEKGRLEPRATKQVVLSGALMEYATRVMWSLAKDEATPDGVRDFAWGALDTETA